MIQIIYGTITGNSELIARLIASTLDSSGNPTTLIDSSVTDKGVLNKDDLCVIVTSAWNAGEVNDSFRPFYDSIEGADLSGVKVALVGLGDRMYGDYYFCKAIDMLEEKLLKHGASIVTDTLKIDGSPEDFPIEDLNQWISSIPL